MFITPINFSYKPAYTKPDNNFKNNNFALNYSHGLKYDTVSFGTGKKIKDEDSHGSSVSLELTRIVHGKAIQGGKDLHWVLKKYLKPLIATNSAPNNPICSEGKGLKIRIKKEKSICDKATTRDIYSLEGLMRMGDIIGARIVLRDTSKNAVDKVLRALIPAVKSGELKLYEIENYYSSQGESYASKKVLNDLRNACPRPIKRFAEESIESGYMAIHLGIETKNGFLAEIQIMGEDVEDLKEVEDLSYKVRCNKPLDDKYKSIQDEIEPAINDMSDDHLGIYMQYIRDSYNYAREKSSPDGAYRRKFDYLPIPYFLPKELDFTYLKKRKIECDRIANAKQ